MWEAVEILMISVELLMWYLQATCQRILRREFGHDFFLSVTNANRLDSRFLCKALEEFDVPADHEHSRMKLKCDFLRPDLPAQEPLRLERAASQRTAPTGPPGIPPSAHHRPYHTLADSIPLSTDRESHLSESQSHPIFQTTTRCVDSGGKRR